MFKSKLFYKSALFGMIIGIIITLFGFFIYNFTTLNVNKPIYDLYLKFITTQYDGEIDKEKMSESILYGITQGLNDEHSTYVYKEDVDAFNQQLKTSHDGIGVMINSNTTDNIVTISQIFDNSPASKSGLYVGDQIKSVNENSIGSDNINDVASLIKQNSETSLEVYRPSTDETLNFDIVNDKYENPSIKSKVIEHDNNNYGYIDIDSFSDNTDEEFVVALSSLEESKIDALIIDVRDNGGGSLNSISNIADQIIYSKDQAYLKTKRDNNVIEEYKSSLSEAKTYPIIGLQNENSASASEILTSALKEANNSDIVGMTSYGKGSVQTLYSLKAIGMGDFKVTTSHWFTFDDNTIQDTGVVPTIEIDNSLNFLNIEPIILTENLKINDDSVQVFQTNYYLSCLGYDVKKESSTFDEKTLDAVKKFQKDNKIEESGIVNLDTSKLLYEKAKEQIISYDNDIFIKTAIDSLK